MPHNVMKTKQRYSKPESVTDIGNDRQRKQASVTRKYEYWEENYLKIHPNKKYNICIHCGLKIIGEPSNIMLDQYTRMLYTTPLSKVCYPCRRETNRLERLQARREKRVKTCPVCGSIFSGQRSDTIYCSFACKQKHYRSETKKKLNVEL